MSPEDPPSRSDRASETPNRPDVLKRDGFGLVERWRVGEGSVLVRRAVGGRWPGSGLAARHLARREQAALHRLAGVEELRGWVPRPLPAPPEAGSHAFAREYLAGDPLWRAERLPRDFFDRLGELVEALHRAGVAHNDLHKEGNVLVLDDGRPALIDFQLATVHDSASRAFDVRRREDLRHVDKHRRRYERAGAPKSPADRAARPPRSPIAATWRRLGKPVYNFVVHGLFRRPSSEPRRPSSGPWPTRTAALGAVREAGLAGSSRAAPRPPR